MTRICRLVTPLLLGVAALVCSGCASHLVRYERDAVTAWADDRLWSEPVRFHNIIIDSRNGPVESTVPFRVRFPDGFELRSDQLPIAELDATGVRDAHFDKFFVGDDWIDRVSGRFPTGTRMLVFQARGMSIALRDHELLFLSFGIGAMDAPDKRPSIGPAEGGELMALPLTLEELESLFGKHEHLYRDFEYRR